MYASFWGNTRTCMPVSWVELQWHVTAIQLKNRIYKCVYIIVSRNNEWEVLIKSRLNIGLNKYVHIVELWEFVIWLALFMIHKLLETIH